MRNLEVDVARIRLAQLRKYDVKRSASEIPEENSKAYAILVEVNGTYINVLNPLEELPVYDRTPYANTTKDGVHDYGNKIVLVNGEEKDGPCYILEKEDMKYEFRKERVSIKDIENYVLSSKLFFADRIKLLDNNRRIPRSLYNKRLLLEDMERLNRLNNYLYSEDTKELIK